MSDIIAAVRAETFSRQIQSDEHVEPQLYFSWDTEEGEVELEVSSDPGQVMKIHAHVKKAPRWFSLNVSLGAGTFTVGDVVGLVADVQGDTEISLDPFIRSLNDGELSDTPLEDLLRVTPNQSVVTILHRVSPEAGLASATDYHTLVLRLPPRDFELTLADLRLFVVPQERGLRPRPETLADAAQ